MVMTNLCSNFWCWRQPCCLEDCACVTSTVTCVLMLTTCLMRSDTKLDTLVHTPHLEAWKLGCSVMFYDVFRGCITALYIKILVCFLMKSHSMLQYRSYIRGLHWLWWDSSGIACFGRQNWQCKYWTDCRGSSWEVEEELLLLAWCGGCSVFPRVWH